MSEKHVHIIELDRWDSEALIRIFREQDPVEIRISVLKDGTVNIQMGDGSVTKIHPPKNPDDSIPKAF